MDWIEPRTCIDENLTVDDNGALCMRPWAVPRLVRDVKANAASVSAASFPQAVMPGFLLMDQKVGWINDSPLECDVLIRVVRSPKEWITSNPNAIQFRDRWSHAVDTDPVVPVTTGIYNSQTGSAIDLGTNTVAEPMPGKQWVWVGSGISDEWVYSVAPGAKLNVWYRCYVWTPPPWSDNANKNSPVHSAKAPYTRIQLMAMPGQGTLVTG